MNSKTKGALAVFVAVIGLLYLFVVSLPYIIAATANILSLVITLVIIVLVIYGLVRLYKTIANS